MLISGALPSTLTTSVMAPTSMHKCLAYILSRRQFDALALEALEAVGLDPQRVAAHAQEVENGFPEGAGFLGNRRAGALVSQLERSLRGLWPPVESVATA